MNSFLSEFEASTTPYGRHRKYGGLLIKFRIIEPDILRVQNLISFDSASCISFIRMVCRLADKHGVTISGKAMPTLVGPSVTKDNTFFFGLDQERLVKLYQKFKFEVIKEKNFYQVMRSPK